MAESVYERLTRGHQEQEAQAKRVRPADLVVVLTVDEQAELAKLSPEDRSTRFRAIQAERGVPK